MSQNTHPVRSEQPEVVKVVGYITGTGAADPTITEGSGIKSCANQSAGVNRFTFLDKHTKLISWRFDFGAATPGDVKNFDAVADDIDTTGDNDFVDVTIYNASGSATDLAASQYLAFEFTFRNTGVQTE